MSGDKDYVCYTRTNKMSMTAEGMIFIKPESVTNSEVKNTADAKVITMQYDVSKLNSSMASQLGLVGDLDSFSVVYTIDKDGYCTSMEQTGTATKRRRDASQGGRSCLTASQRILHSSSKPAASRESAHKSDAE